MKKILLLIICIFTLCLSSCSSAKRLEIAFKNLSTKSYTAEIKTTIKFTYANYDDVDTITTLVLIECDDKQMYTKVINPKTNDDIEYIYAKVLEDYVIVCRKGANYSNWNYTNTPISSFNSEIDIIEFDVSLDDIFSYRNGIYDGKIVMLNKVFKNQMKEIMENSGLNSSEEISIKQYNIKLKNFNVENIIIKLKTHTAYLGEPIEITLKMEYSFTKIGKTNVTIPSDLTI